MHFTTDLGAFTVKGSDLIESCLLVGLLSTISPASTLLWASVFLMVLVIWESSRHRNTQLENTQGEGHTGRQADARQLTAPQQAAHLSPDTVSR